MEEEDKKAKLDSEILKKY